MTETEHVSVDPELACDPNYQALVEAQEQGKFATLPKEVWVMFANGVLVGTANSLTEILAMGPEDTRCFIHQPNMPEIIYDLPSPIKADNEE